ncbi:MAG: hypothetical protein K2N34_08440 [Lachnospiraceae bacterium]|nr:hypothetical protein [Lachnospiraceae bacterium]
MQSKKIVIAIAAMCIGYAWGEYAGKKKELRKKSNAQKYLSIYKPWMEKMQKGESIADFVINKQYENVAVYGLGKLGVSLINELKDKGIPIAYIIDQRADEIFYEDIDVYSFSERLPDVGAIIITTVNDQKELREKIMCRLKCDVYTLEELVMHDRGTDNV